MYRETINFLLRALTPESLAMIFKPTNRVVKWKQKVARPCLQCGELTTHSQPFHTAECKRLWDAEHPHNGQAPMRKVNKKQWAWLQANKLPGGRLDWEGMSI